jgi:hypothetical protein
MIAPCRLTTQQSTAAVPILLAVCTLIMLFIQSSRSNSQYSTHKQHTTRRLNEDIIPGPILNEQLIPEEHEAHELSPEEITERHIKQYLGGLYPKVDRQFHPLYLRDTLHPREIDPKWGEVVDGDIPFFWYVACLPYLC